MGSRRSSMVEHLICNQGVVGSSPTVGSVATGKPSPKVIGELSEVEVFCALHRAGLGVLTPPFSDNLRYDCIVDDGERLSRVQVKTGRLEGGCIEFNACRTYWHRRASYTYRGQIDFFGVWCGDLGRVYLVPVLECGVSLARLRVEPPRNGQRRGVRWASDYELRPGWRAGPTEVRERRPVAAKTDAYTWRPSAGLTKVNCGLTL